MNLLLMALMGGLGAVARFVTDAALRSRITVALPVGTLLSNLLGSFILGGLTAGVVRGGLDPDVRLVLGTGFCGGFTTFSTASVEVVRLVQSGRVAAGLGHLLANAIGCVAAAALAYALF